MHMVMSVVVIESPYSGDIDRNIRYLALCGFDAALLHDELAYASHAWMTQHPRAKGLFVSDYDPKWDVLTRNQAIALSQRMRHLATMTVFYVDLGWSSGMMAARAYCEEHDLPYTCRTLDIIALSSKVSFCTREFCRAIIDRKPYEHFLEPATTLQTSS